MSTVIVLAVFGSAFVLSLALWVMLLRLGLKLMKVPDVTKRRLATAAIMTTALNLVGAGVTLSLERTSLAVAVVAGLAINHFLPLLIIVRVFKASFASSVVAWLMTLVSPTVMLAIVYFGIRPYVLEAFHSPSNSMAPTLLGPHWEGRCTECGSPSYCSPQRPYGEDPVLICRDHFHMTTAAMPAAVTYGSDKFLVAKYLTPQRWDIIVFRYPSAPATLYVMRLVGLPGEEITIHDGQVRANGSVLTLPVALREITYEDEFPDRFSEISGSTVKPAKLGSDEYFVLGDFTARSNDSRMWLEGAAGHSVYAVPRSHIVGVVTHIYWPLDRLRILR